MPYVDAFCIGRPGAIGCVPAASPTRPRAGAKTIGRFQPEPNARPAPACAGRSGTDPERCRPDVDVLADLNESQIRAVRHVDGPLLVLAGAGSGKTLVITRRIGHLVASGVDPSGILAVTFTNKAAGEMAERVRGLGVPRGATISTFHSFAARLLRRHAAAAGLARDFTIYDADDQLRCVKEALKEAEVPSANFSLRAVHAAISRAKNELLDPGAYAGKASRYFEEVVARVYRAYQRLLSSNGALDFDDLLMRTALLFRDRPDIRVDLGRRYRYILIDEYQDTNHAQYVIAHGIALEHENICATGDPDQSIYGWRGADLNNILDFESDYPDAVVVRLERNYRSVQPILSSASNLISCNRRRKHKRLVAVRPGGREVDVVRLQDEHAEADEVVARAVELRDAGVPCRDMAVFYRVNALSRVLEQAFRSAGVPYQIARGVEFYNRKEIKDALAYLRLLANPRDDLSCRRIINVPPRGIGAVTVNRLSTAAERRGASLLAACADPEAAGVGRAAAAKVRAFADLMESLTGAGDDDLGALVEAVLDRTGLEAALSERDEDLQALRNVQELVTAAAEFQASAGEAGLAEFLQQVSLVSDVDAVDPDVGAVTLMTLHAAKGLEFSVVFMVGCEEGLLPFERPDRRERDTEEERRLAFVGMTRAKDRLFLTSARHRTLRGVNSRQSESGFLHEIGRDHVRRTDKTVGEPAPRRGPISVAEFNRRPGPDAGAFYEDVGERAIIEAMEAAELIPERFAGIRPGRRVRHRKFGTGKVLTVSGDGTRTRAVVQFDRAGRKTLILERAHLEPM